MKNNFSHFGFTLVELIVGITISMLLMVSVGVFVSGGMQNVFLQQKVFENAGDFVEFNTTFQSSLDNIDGSFSGAVVGSGLIFKTQKYFGNGGFTYVGTALSEPGYYCSGSEDPADDITDHMFIKHFIPFFETTEDTTDPSLALSTSVTGYNAFTQQHIVKDSGGNIVVGREIFGQKLGTTGSGTYLNSPTGLAIDGDVLYISDTLNNRILAYNTTDLSIEVLLDSKDGLNEPTGLTMSGSSLLIINAGAGEILEYSSKQQANYPDYSIEFDSVYPNITDFNLSIINAGSIVPAGLTQGNFTNLDIVENFFREKADNSGEYLFVSYDPVQNNGACSSTQKIYNSGDPIDCKNSGSGASSSPNPVSISTIDLENISGIPGNGAHYFHVILSDGYEQYFPYFTQGDDDLLTKDDNTLSVIASGLIFPVGWDTAGNILEMSTHFINNLSFSLDDVYDSILPTPVNGFDVLISANLLSISGSYYKNYNCYNPDLRITREFIWKKNLK